MKRISTWVNNNSVPTEKNSSEYLLTEPCCHRRSVAESAAKPQLSGPLIAYRTGKLQLIA